MIENLVLHGGSTVGQLKSLVKTVQALENLDKYHLSEGEFIGKSSILQLLDKISKLNTDAVAEGGGVDNIVLRPLTNVIVDPTESEEDFTRRMMESTRAREEDRDDGSDWMKIYSTFVKARQEGKLDELQLEVS